jgi:lysyl-tRNA synthetase class 2
MSNGCERPDRDAIGASARSVELGALPLQPVNPPNPRRSASAAPVSWRPTSTLEALRRRAELLARVRRFFADRGILEVETPYLATGVIVDAHIDPSIALYRADGGHGTLETARVLRLHTSPEAAMKRLLAAGSGPIYEIARVFRDGEVGRAHNPEFTMVEWYRPGFTLEALMDEVDALIQDLLGTPPADRRSYREIFRSIVGLDPWGAAAETLAACAARELVPVPESFDRGDRDAWLELILSARISPILGSERPIFVFDYPPTQAALARVHSGPPPVARRFELFYRGRELANGYDELRDVTEHRRRFETANSKRAAMGKEVLPVDEEFLAAIEHGLPESSGVALGFDRVVMLALGAESIADVISFGFTRSADVALQSPEKSDAK